VRVSAGIGQAHDGGMGLGTRDRGGRSAGAIGPDGDGRDRDWRTAPH